MAETTSTDGDVKELLSATEAVADVLSRGNQKPTFLNSRIRATKSQLQLQLDSERKGRQELQSVVDELKQAMEQADAERIKYQQELHRMNKEHETMRKAQQLCNALTDQMLANGPLRDGTE